MMAWEPYFAMISFQRVVTLLVILQLHAQAAPGDGVVRISAHPQQDPLFVNLEQHGASIWAVVGTPTKKSLGRNMLVHRFLLLRSARSLARCVAFFYAL